MKSLWINKNAIASIVLAGSIALSVHSCNMGNKNEPVNDSNIEITDVTLENSNITPSIVSDEENKPNYNELLNKSQYRAVEGDNRYTLLPNTNIYLKDDDNISEEFINNDSFMVYVYEYNDEYSLVKFPNNQMGYVNNNSLIKCANLTNSSYIDVTYDNDDILLCDAYLYNENGMYIGYLSANQNCYVLATNGEYTLISLSDGREGYVLNKSLTNNNKQINGYGYIRSGRVVYRDTDFTKPAYVAHEYQIVEVLCMNKKYATIFDNEINDTFYIRPEDLDDDFILVDLDTQRMDCYIDYQIAGSWGTRSGKDSTPTHSGTFDIDWMAEDWDFTNYPGSHARYWMPINDYGEGIHDLVGDDEQNYGNQAYHQYGSHGCIRVPSAASKFVYDNYEVGDMVLVRKK